MTAVLERRPERRAQAASKSWRTDMTLAVAQISDAVSHGRNLGLAAAGRMWAEIVARIDKGDVREPARILAQWRAVDAGGDGEDVATGDAVPDPPGHVLAKVLRAEYASAFLERSDLQRDLAGVPGSPGGFAGVSGDPRAADAANQLVGVLWRDAAASVRFALYEPGTPQHTDAEQELERLREEAAELEMALRERPWTEEA